MVIDFHPAASDEAEAAHRWYAERSSIAAARFREELDAAVADIQTDPDCGAPYLHGTRCYLLRRFPYLVVYHRPSEAAAEVIAVAHGRRRPGYWKARTF
ncbi:MAG: type II toxin-antitoxin system RelE/ParE family toxin [Planctomycetes bacterium]|nr:type II toxin-antitoxin system RelE/ParE family toxin [Planctomycetota bacterium]